MGNNLRILQATKNIKQSPPPPTQKRKTTQANLCAYETGKCGRRDEPNGMINMVSFMGQLTCLDSRIPR